MNADQMKELASRLRTLAAHVAWLEGTAANFESDVRAAADLIEKMAQADPVEQHGDALVDFLVAQRLEIAQRLSDDLRRAHPRIQRRVRILEHGLQLAAKRADLPGGQRVFTEGIHDRQRGRARHQEREMKLPDFFRAGPQLTHPVHGTEPSLYRVLVHYYTSHGKTNHDAVKFANDYIAAFLRKVEK